MGEVLDQSEVDALLAAVDGGEIEVEVEEVARPQRHAAVYDFKRPERVSKDQIRSLEMLHEVFARNFGASLSAYLRTIVEVRLETVDQLTYSEFIMSLPNPTCFCLLSCAPLDGNMILEVNPAIVYPIIDRLMGGGKGSTTLPDRPLTDIEWSLVETIIHRALTQLRVSWASVREIDFQVQQTESNPQLMQIVPPNEPVVLVCFELTMGEHTGLLNLCMPFMTIEAFINVIAAHTWAGYARRAGTSTDRKASMFDRIRSAEVEVACTLLETELSLGDVMKWKPGDELLIDQPASSLATLAVEGRPKFVVERRSYRGHRALVVRSKLERDGTREGESSP